MKKQDYDFTDYNWKEVFACAGDPEGGENSADVRPALPDDKVSLEPFGRQDLAKVYAVREGEHDEYDWLVYGKLKDGRYFFLSAGCDYTGWDCQSGGCAFVSMDRKKLEQFGISARDREALGI